MSSTLFAICQSNETEVCGVVLVEKLILTFLLEFSSGGVYQMFGLPDLYQTKFSYTYI